MRDEELEEELGTKELKHLLYTLPVDKPLGPVSRTFPIVLH